MSVRFLKVTAAIACVAAVAWLTITRVAGSSAEDEARAWAARTSTLLAKALVTEGPPRLVLPPTRVDTYQTAQATLALAGAGELTDDDWSAFSEHLTTHLGPDLAEGYAGPQALAARVVAAATAADRDLPTAARDALVATADSVAGDDVYDALAAVVVRRWAAENGGPEFVSPINRRVSEKIRATGCRGTEALFVQGELARAGTDLAPAAACPRADLDRMVAAARAAVSRAAAATASVDSEVTLRLLALDRLARTDADRADVSRLKGQLVDRLNAAQVSDPIPSAATLAEVQGAMALAPSLVGFLHTSLAWGGAPVDHHLSPAAAATLARTFELAGDRSPGPLLPDDHDLPPETRARVLLASGASDAEVDALLRAASPSAGPDARSTAFFQLLLRHGALGCAAWQGHAHLQAADQHASLLERAVAYRYLADCGGGDATVEAEIRADHEALRPTDVRSIHTDRAVTCALEPDSLPTVADNWAAIKDLVEPAGGAEDDAGDLGVAETHQAILLVSDQTEACSDGVYW